MRSHTMKNTQGVLTYDWASLHMELAGEENSKAEELLVKRVPYYGICLAAPFVLMRHWDEWQEKHTFTIDDKDKALCNLILNIQYANQKYFFGKYAQSYFDNQKVEQASTNSYQSKYQRAWEALPEEFNSEQAQKAFGHEKLTATSMFLTRLVKRGCAKRMRKGVFKKLSNTL